MEDLKLCPFCGGEAELTEGTREYYNMYMVYCMKCGINTDYCNSEQEAINMWNQRV